MDRSTETVELVGNTLYNRNGAYLLAHRERITIARDRVESAIEGHGEGCATVDPVVSFDPSVIQYERDKDEARRISDYRNRPIHSLFKPAKPRKRG